MQKKSYRHSSKVARSANHVVGSLFETLENRALLSAAPQLLAAEAEPAAQFQALRVKAADTTPVINVTPVSNFAREDGRLAYFQFTRTGSTTSPLTVKLSISGIARNGRDYETLPNTFTFQAGQAKAYLAVKPLQDTIVERVERVGVTVAPSAGYTVGTNAYADLRILDDDAPTVSVAAPQGATLAEDSSTPAYVTFYRTGDLKNPVTINYTIRGKAANGVDYVNIARSITIRAGKTKANLALKSVDDLNPENDEYIDLRLSGGYYNAVTKASRAVVKVQDNDTAQLGLDFVTFRGPSVNGKSYILRAPVSGGTPANLSNALTNLGKAGDDYAVNVSPDGQWMLFNTTR
ncbi:MAG TPA: Calx-beta domain-containing protein, partial [Tepidisphaeraceae bacterium]|nr:Calx-beta domain-containing protein [Tepidisphaeraceae bacterium]